jgi:hypothetical protein
MRSTRSAGVMVAEAVYLGFVIGNLVLITGFRFQASAFPISGFSVSPTASVLRCPPSASGFPWPVKSSLLHWAAFQRFPRSPMVSGPWSHFRFPLSAFSFPHFRFSVWPAPAAQGHGSSDGPAQARSDSLATGRSLGYSVSPCKRELALSIWRRWLARWWPVRWSWALSGACSG